MNSLHPPRLMCDETNCALCDMMKKRINEYDWCFEWLRHLKDFEASQELAEKDRQVILMVKHSDNEVRHIRSRLAVLQTQTASPLLTSFYGGCNTHFFLLNF
jgi:hypothetical protein